MNEQIKVKIDEFIRSDNDMMFKVDTSNKHFIIDFQKVISQYPELDDEIIEDPENFLRCIEEVVFNLSNKDVLSKKKIPVRIKNFHLNNQSSCLEIGVKRVEHINKLWWFRGVVKTISEVTPTVNETTIECINCGTHIRIEQALKYVKKPKRCTCGQTGRFREISQSKQDMAKLVLEEELEFLSGGEQPKRLNVLLKQGLTKPEIYKMVLPGKRVIITGILKDIPKTTKDKEESTEREWLLIANYIEPIDDNQYIIDITDQDVDKIKQLSKDKDIYRILIDSVAPEIYGYNNEKLALILQGFGGVSKYHPETKQLVKRGKFHVLLVGDPSCLIADERIILSDGTIELIGNMGKYHLQNIDYKVHIGKGHNIGVVTTFHKYEKQPIIEIITETGKCISGTYNQEVLLNKDNMQEWKRLDELKIGDKIQCIPKIDCYIKSLIPINWRRIKLKNTFNKIIPNLPKYLDEKLAGIIGHIISDGYVMKYKVGHCINTDELDIAEILTQYYQDCFGTTLLKYNHKHTSDKIFYYISHSKQISTWLSFCKIKRIPSLIFKSRDSVVASFLSWLFEGDGCVYGCGRGRTAISYKSIDIELLRDIQIILLRFGINSRIIWDKKDREVKIKGRIIKSSKNGNLVIRRGESIIKFKKHIDFISKKKKKRLDEVCKYKLTKYMRIRKRKSEKVVSIKQKQNEDVFDIEVPIYNRFVANGLVVHNTAKTKIAKGIMRILPKTKYSSGSHASAGGLTWTAEYDEFIGAWTVQAGTMILANGGVAIIDELDKVNKEQVGRLNEALEELSIHADKASIHETLRADTSMIGIANPKSGRFNPYYTNIFEEINIDPSLVTRASLIFLFRQENEEGTMRAVVQHIYDSHSKTKEIYKTNLPETLIKKYIIYANENCFPKLLPELKKYVEDQFIEVVKKGNVDGRVAITYRQFEDVLRLSEAHAKIRLSDIVEKQDIDTAFNLINYSLKSFATDSTGKIDVDIIELGGKGYLVRNKENTFHETLKELETEFGKKIEIQELVNRLVNKGFSDLEAEKWIENSKTKGDLFEPKNGFVVRIE